MEEPPVAGHDEPGVRLLDAAVELMGRAGVRGTLQVRGESMTPTLRPGDLVAVDFSQTSLRRGDVLVFRQADYLTVHRLLGTARLPDGSPCLRTRGDGRNRLDPPLDRSRVHGRVFAVLRDGVWRDMRSGGARFYASALATHDLAWAAVGVVAARLDRRTGRAGRRLSLGSATAFIDQKLLALMHRLLFSRFHSRIDRPEGLESVPSGGPHSP
jgi:hypothetical protein